jgi:hypothetical protein
MDNIHAVKLYNVIRKGHIPEVISIACLKFLSLINSLCFANGLLDNYKGFLLAKLVMYFVNLSDELGFVGEIRGNHDLKGCLHQFRTLLLEAGLIFSKINITQKSIRNVKS